MRQGALTRNSSYAEIFRDCLLFLFALFVLGFFLFPDAPTHYKFYYYWIMVPAVFFVKPYFAEISRDGILILLVLFGSYLALSGLWSRPFDGQEYLFQLRAIAAVILFVMLLIGLAARLPDQFERLLQLLCIVAATMAIASLVYFYSDNPFPRARAHGFGRMDSINRGAAAYGMFVIVAAGYFLRHSDWKRYVFGFAAVSLLAFVLMNQTRSAIIAVLIGLLVLVLLEGGRKVLLLLAALLLATGLAIAQFLPELWTSIGRSMSWRPGIWLSVLAQFKEASLFGHGILVDTSVLVPGGAQGYPRTFNHAHSAYLATARDGGVVGLALMLALMFSAYAGAIQVFKRSADARLIALLIYATLVMVPITDRLFTKPREQWLYFWMPVALVVIYRRYAIREVAGTGGSGPATDAAMPSMPVREERHSRKSGS